MTNQSKWLISAYAIFHGGGVLVPLDYKLTAAEHLQLLAHSKAKFLVVEYYLWRAIMQSPEFKDHKVQTVLVTEAPPGADLAGAFRWEDFRRKGDPVFVPRQRQDVACIVYSSGTGGRPKGCVLTHENYLEQCKALICAVSLLAGRALSQHSAHQSRHRFHGRLYRAICLRRVRGAFAHAAAGVRARRLRPLQDHLREPGSHGAQESGARAQSQV